MGGLPGILSIKPQFWLSFLVAMAAAIVIPFALTYMIGKKKLPQDTAAKPLPQAEPEEVKEFAAPVSGKIIPLEEIPDQVFSRGVLGMGVGIQPTGSRVVAPADGNITALMEDSGHACGLALDNGVELLVHVGMDTVDMAGKGFQVHVKEGQRVKRGDLLITFDPQAIQEAGHPTTTAFVVTETAGKNFRYLSGMEAQAGQTAVIREE